MAQPLPFSVDRMLAQEVPKLFQLADDMHAMASYMNDLRIIAILGTVMGIVGGIGFLIFKYTQKKKSDGYDVCPRDEYGRHGPSPYPHHTQTAFAPVSQWQDRGKVSDIESKLAIRLPEQGAVIRNGDGKHGGDPTNV